MANFQITQSPLPDENNEFNFSNLYLFHTHSGPNRNQFSVTSEDPATGLGQIAVNNWEIYDGVGESTTIVARAQGMHIHAGNWTNVFSIVFEDKRYTPREHICYPIHNYGHIALYNKLETSICKTRCLVRTARIGEVFCLFYEIGVIIAGA